MTIWLISLEDVFELPETFCGMNISNQSRIVAIQYPTMISDYLRVVVIEGCDSLRDDVMQKKY